MKNRVLPAFAVFCFALFCTTVCSAQTVKLSVTGIAFGNVVVNSTSTKTLTITNKGTANLVISSIATTGSFGWANCSGATIIPNGTCTVNVTFTPAATGSASSTLSITDNASNSPQSINLTGSGVLPVTLTPTSLTFTGQVIFTTSAAKTATLTNNQSIALNVSSFSTSGPFSASACPAQIAPTSSCVINITFTPTTTGKITGKLTIVDDAGTQTVTLQGTGGQGPALVSITVTPANPSMAVPASQPFTATGNYSNGTQSNVTSYAAWASSATTVATINAAGTATAVGAGSTTVTATYAGISGTTTLTVTPPALVSIAVTPANSTIASGTTQQFAATGTYSDGSTGNVTGLASWGSSNTTIASVSTAGLASTFAQGTVTITATVGAISGSTGLTAGPPNLVSIAVTPSNASIAAGSSQQFTATGTYTGGSTQNLTTQVNWSSSLPSVNISNTSGSNGLASTTAQGTATITATLGSISGSTSLTITQAALASIAISPSAASVAQGLNQQFTATGTFTDGSTQNVTATVTWGSTLTSVATISNSPGTQGLAMAVNQGATSISATSGAVSNSVTFTVLAPVLVSITVTPDSPNIALNTTQQFTATGTYTDGSTQNLTNSATWSSSATSVASISNTPGTQGLATAVARGSSEITAVSGSISANTVLTVGSVSLTSIAVNPPSASIAPGSTQQFTATGSFSDGSMQDVTQSVSWSAGNGTVATISNSAPTQGLASAVADGGVQIVASLNSVTGTAQLTVAPLTLQSIAVTPANPSLPTTAMQQFTATGTFNDGSMQNLTNSVTWSSSNPSVASITSGGLASSAGAGTSTITATSGSVSGSTVLTYYVVIPTLVSIAVTPTSATLLTGAAQQFTATGTFSDGSMQDQTSTGVTWSAGGIQGGNAALGTISAAGLYTAPAALPSPPQVAITATSTANSAISGGATATVNQITVTVSPSAPQVEISQTQQFTATVTGTSNMGVTWSVGGIAGGNTTLGTISAGGLYTAPASVPSPAQVTVTATSVVNGLTNCAATVTVIPTIQVSVLPASLQHTSINTTQQFTATVTNTSNTAVIWSVGGMPGGNNIVGTISSTGLYTAPVIVPEASEVYITATSVADPTKSAYGLDLISPPSGVSLTISPTAEWLQYGQTVQYTTRINGSSNQNVTWAVNGIVGGNSTVGTINSSGLYTAPNIIPNPPQLTITCTSAANTNAIATGTLTIGATPFSALPIVDFALMPGQLYLGQFAGMLYNGSNSPPPEQVAEGIASAALVQPLDVNGNPDPNGKIVFISVGMSEAADEWCEGQAVCTADSFVGQASANPNVNHSSLVIVDGAIAGAIAETWTCASGPCPIGKGGFPNQYDRVLNNILTPNGLTEKQVQVVWIESATQGPTWFPSLPNKSSPAYGHEYDLAYVLRTLRQRWPNVRQVFIEDRIYAGYATTFESPEPYAYEYGFGEKWLIQAQITQRDTGTIDPVAGDLLTNVPWIDWAAYVWGNDSNNIPGSLALNWPPSYFEPDGTHPSPTLGTKQIGATLVNFFLNSPATPWFRN